jgi:hypothetical protein
MTGRLLMKPEVFDYQTFLNQASGSQPLKEHSECMYQTKVSQRIQWDCRD